MTKATLVVKGKVGYGVIKRQSNAFVIGSGFSCALPLDDPMAAEQHCVVYFTGDGFELDDLQTGSGTYINGRAVTERVPLRDGAEIVLGFSRLFVSCEGSNLEIRLEEKGFYFDRGSDPLLWSRTELGFGKFAPLAIGNRVAAGLLLVGAAILFLSGARDVLLEPGPLSEVHRSALLASKVESGCESCHPPGGVTQVDACGDCHAETVGAGHPFGEFSGGCSPCHVEHRGGREGAMLTREAGATCGDCHDPDISVSGERVIPEAPLVDAEIVFDTFSHADHVEQEDIACARCHRESSARGATAGLAAAGGTVRDYPVVSFEVCMTCHGPEAGDDRAEAVYDVMWHGTDDEGRGCLQCHQQVYEVGLAQISTVKGPGEFEFESRPHAAELAAHLAVLAATGRDAQACGDCHSQADVSGGRKLRSPFRHATHVPGLVLTDDPTALAEGSDRCVECHREQIDASSLSEEWYRGPDSSHCARCHATGPASARGADDPSVPVFREPEVTAGALPRNNFPHRFHVGKNAGLLETGCFACHGFSDEGLAARPTTTGDAGQCMPCHAAHSSIAGGGCRFCHGEDDAVYRNVPRRVSRPANPRFSHSTPGHAALAAQGNEGCQTCHEGVESTSLVSEIGFPQEASTQCRGCHVGSKARFHWR